MGMGKWAPETKSAILRLLEEFVFGDISVFSGLAGRVFFFFFSSFPMFRLFGYLTFTIISN